MILITKMVTDGDDNGAAEDIDSENGYHVNVDLLMNSDDGDGGETRSSSEYRDDDGDGREKGGCNRYSGADDEGEDDEDNEKDVGAYVGVWEKKKILQFPLQK